MSDMTFSERARCEALFGMSSGYVSNFSDRTFREFVQDSIHRDIYDKRYNYASGSKANRLRKLWREDPNHVVGKLLQDLIDYTRRADDTPEIRHLQSECNRIAERLLRGAPIEDFEAISSGNVRCDFERVVSSVRSAIDRNEPQSGLDHLHTFVVKFMRGVCLARGVPAGREKPLHSLMGEYIKRLREAGHLESVMTERILKSSIGVLDAYSHVRNEQSLAHDNPLLNYDESLLILNHVAATVRFVSAIEEGFAKQATDGSPTANDKSDDLPF
ncbi:MAG: abortive infection family protein [Candidatus Zixiibacteriota bacterium]